MAAALVLSACASTFSTASSNEIFYKDGKVAYVASCRSANWGPCLEMAGEICKEAGYTTLEKSNRWTSNGDEKEMVFACNGKSTTVEIKPSLTEAKQ